MSLLGDLAESAIGALTGGASGGANTPQHNQVAAALLEAIANHQGGVPDLLSRFESAGFGGHVASWVGAAQNLPITAEELQQVLGSPLVADVAAKVGLDQAEVAKLAAEVFPQLVNHLTPQGTVTEEHRNDGLVDLAEKILK